MNDRHPEPAHALDDAGGGSSGRSLDDVLAEVTSLREEVEALRSREAGNRQTVSPHRAGANGAGASRRQLLRVAAGGAVGLVAGSAVSGGQRAAAADPNDVVKNTSNLVTDTTTLDGTFPGPTFSLFNRDDAENSAALYGSSSAEAPTFRADNDTTAGLGGVGVAGNAPGGLLGG